VGLRVGGTFANPSVGLDPAATGQALVQGAAGLVTGIAQGGAGAIGGLFGGGGQQPQQQRPAAAADGCAAALAQATGRPAPAQPAAAPAQQQQAPAPQQAPVQQPGGLLPGGIPNPFRR
jgi:hypothetical protein